MSKQGSDVSGEEPVEQPHGDEDAIARRAYEISQSEHSGTAEENWRRAEEELRGGHDEP